MTVDALGRFLFIVNFVSNDISMFGINPDGSLTEVAGSPFTAGHIVNPAMTASLPVCLATEKSRQFLYVGYEKGDFPDEGAIVEYLIDSQGSPLIPFASTDFPAAPVGIVTSPQGYLDAALRPVSGSSQGGQLQGITAYSIHPTSGQLTPVPGAGNVNRDEQTIAIDRQGRFLFDAWGERGAGFIEGAPILSDGTAGPSAPAVELSSSASFPSPCSSRAPAISCTFKKAGALLRIRFIRPRVALTSRQIPPASLILKDGSAAADPMGPYIYSLQSGFVRAFQVGDPSPGQLSELPDSPYLVASAGGAGGLAISGAPESVSNVPPIQLTLIVN